MLNRIVQFALRWPGAIFLLTLALIVSGLVCYRMLDVEAYPNPVPPLVEVIVQPEGWSAEEVERYVTLPLEVGLSGMPGLDHLRSQSLFGLSDVKCYFNWDTPYQNARQEVLNRLSFIKLPNNLQSEISPWNGIGEILRFLLRGSPGYHYSQMDLKTAADWILDREFKQVPGVIDLTTFGGEIKQYQVELDPYKLAGYGVTLTQVESAITNANQNVGGQKITRGEQSYDVRGVGLIRSTRDIDDITIAVQKGVPIRVRDVAEVKIGPKPRLGIVGFNNEPDVVEGTVLMRYGAETAPTLKGVHERIETVRKNQSLPPGMDIEPIYDRGELVAKTTHTVMENLLLGMGLVVAVLLIFLGRLRAGLLAALNIPLALLATFCGMILIGTPANLISLGAVDFGIIVDSTVIMVENIMRHLGGTSNESIRGRIVAAAAEVSKPMLFSTLVLGVAFLPLFTMNGVSGVIFSPLAHTYAFAIGGAILLALTLTPILAERVLRVEKGEGENRLMHVLQRLYRPLFDFGLKTKRLAVGYLLVPIVGCALLFHAIGGEFMPQLEEGNLWIRVNLLNSASYEKTSSMVGRMRAIIRAHPEVQWVLSQLGRPDDGTDPSGFSNIEFLAPLKPAEEWKSGQTKEHLIEEITRELDEAFPGVNFTFSQYIADNVEEAVSGVKSENSIKVVGPELKTNQRIAEQIANAIKDIPGVKDLGVISALGQPNVTIIADRARCARFGLNTGDIEAMIQAAIGGQTVTQVYEGEKLFDVVVRWLPPYRQDVEAIRRILVPAPDGSQIPLAQIATITTEDGPYKIYREDLSRYTPVKFSVRGRDLESVIADAKAKINSQVNLPYGTHLDWAGQIKELEEAGNRLRVIIPITLALIIFLVYSAVGNWALSVVVLSNIPIACLGGLLALLVTGINNSVSADMGFVSVFGIAIQDAILVVTYAQRQWNTGKSAEEGVLLASKQRLRAVLMTTFVAMFGLLPAAISNRLGAQAQKPLAVVVIGGALALAVLTRMLQPALLIAAHRFFRKSTISAMESEE